MEDDGCGKNSEVAHVVGRLALVEHFRKIGSRARLRSHEMAGGFRDHPIARHHRTSVRV